MKTSAFSYARAAGAPNPLPSPFMVCMPALDAIMVVSRQGGERRLAAVDHFTGVHQAVSSPDRLPLAPESTRRHGVGGAVSAVAAVANAVRDALRPFGVVLTEIPLTPRVVRTPLGRV